MTNEQIIDRLAGLPDDASREKLVTRYPRLLSPSFVAELVETVRTLVKVDLKKACALADAAITIASRLGDKESTAFALRAKANTFWSLGQNKEASNLHAQAVQLFDEVGKPVEAGRTLSISIQPLILLGEYERAHAAAERARRISRD
jgi:hypothetical protein